MENGELADETSGTQASFFYMLKQKCLLIILLGEFHLFEKGLHRPCFACQGYIWPIVRMRFDLT